MTKTLSKKNLNWSQITFIGFIVLSVIFSCSRPTIAKGNTDLRSKDVKPKEELFEHHSNLGISYLDQQKYSDAVTEFQKALEIEPKHLPTIVNLGLSYHHQLQFDEAVKTFKRALEIDPNEPYSHYNLGLIYYVKNRFDEAESELKKVVSVDPNDPAARYHLAMVYSKQGRLDEAEKQFRAVIKLYPDSSSAYYGLSRALMDAGKKEEVEEVLKKFQELRNTGRVSSEKDKYLREGKYLEPMIPIEKVPLIKEIAKKSSSVRFVDVTSGAGLKFRHGGSGTIPPESIEAKGHESLSEYTPDYIKSKIVSSLGSGAVLFDYDNDAYLDLYIVNCNSAPPAPRASRQAGNALYHNNGNGTFTDVTAKAGVGNIDMGMGCAVGDYNNDGNPDLYVTSIGKDSSSFLFD
jgi:Flp pilus assembly protein TadD